MLTRLTRTAAGTNALVMEEGVASGFKVLKVTAIWRNFRTPQQIECKETETDYMQRDQWRYRHLLRLTLLCKIPSLNVTHLRCYYVTYNSKSILLCNVCNMSHQENTCRGYQGMHGDEGCVRVRGGEYHLQLLA